jgi:hypothetical protein
VTKEEILAKLQAGEISEKGGVSVYGLQRMPVTLYMEQWDRLLTYGEEIKSFIAANSSKLKRKGE